MRHAMGAIPFLLAIGALPALAQTLPASCGAVGASSYTPPAVTIPAVVLNRGTVITVTNATMAINGDTSSVAALVANPGPDGISLQEAVIATNNDPGTWNIQFAPALKGSTIVVDSGPNIKSLSALSGGNVTINGDIDGDGLPDITLTSQSVAGTGILVFSGGNTLYGLALQNCGICVLIKRPAAATGTTFSNITLSNLVMTNIQTEAIVLSPVLGEAGVSGSNPAAVTYNTWDHILITNNTISGSASGPPLGIDVGLGGTVGDTLQHVIIANNNIVLPMAAGAASNGIVMTVGGGIASTNNQALDSLIASNAISTAPNSNGIRIAAGVGSASDNLIDGMQVIANQIQVTGQLLPSSEQPVGIDVAVGDGASDDKNPSLLPIQYSENNIARNISILSNTIERAAGFGIFAAAACCGNSNNTIDNLSILGNTMTGNVQLEGGASGGFLSRPSTGNSLSNVLVQANSIRSLTPPGNPNFTLEGSIAGAGIGVWAGSGGVGNSFNGLSIANNDVNTAFIGISIVAGCGFPGQTLSLPTTNNVVAHPQIFCNQLDQVATLGIAPSSGVQGINVAAGVDVATGNRVLGVRVENNLIAGVLNDASFFANLGDGASGNSISVSRILAPGSCDPRISLMLGTTCRPTPPGRGR
ncbi:MAG: hypothetical protein ABSF62_16890 [Bryobacteraceae bacterium]